MPAAIAAAAAWVGGTLFTAGTAAAATTATIVSSACYGAIAGAVVGGVTAAVKGGDIVKGALTGAVYGAIGGAVAGAASSLFGSAAGATGGTAGGAVPGETAGLITSADPSGMAGIFGIEAGIPPSTGISIGTQTVGNVAGGLIQNAATPPPAAPPSSPQPSWIERNPAGATMLGNTIGQGAIAMLGADPAEENEKNRLATAMEADKLRASKIIDLSRNTLMSPLPSIYNADQFAQKLF
jgi:hypothetical protein